MQLWELTARESIRDLVTRYNSNGDAGRFALPGHRGVGTPNGAGDA